MQTDGINGGNVNIPTDDLPHFQQLAVQLFIAVQNLLGGIVQFLALPGQAKFLLTSIDNQNLEVSFHRPELLTDGRLGNRIHPGGLGKTPGLHQIGEYPEICYIHNPQYN